MKKIILSISIIILSVNLFGQNYNDYIIKQNNDTIKCSIVDVNYSYITFKYLDIRKSNGKVKTQIKLTDVKKYKLFKDNEEHNPNLSVNPNHYDNYGQITYNDYIIKLNNDTIKNCKITNITDEQIHYNYLNISGLNVTTWINLNQTKKYKCLDVEHNPNLSVNKNTNINLNIVDNKVDKLIKNNSDDFILLNNKIENINTNMLLSHKEFKTGTGLLIAGVIISGIGGAFLAGDNIGLPIVLCSVGSILTIVGGILHIDSHKYIGCGYNKYVEKQPLQWENTNDFINN